MSDSGKHVTDQLWLPEVREDGVYLVAQDGTTVVKLCRPDRGSDLLIAGYVAGLQVKSVKSLSPAPAIAASKKEMP